MDGQTWLKLMLVPCLLVYWLDEKGRVPMPTCRSPSTMIAEGWLRTGLFQSIRSTPLFPWDNSISTIARVGNKTPTQKEDHPPMGCQEPSCHENLGAPRGRDAAAVVKGKIAAAFHVSSRLITPTSQSLLTLVSIPGCFKAKKK